MRPNRTSANFYKSLWATISAIKGFSQHDQAILRLLPVVCLAKIPVINKHWTSLFAPATVGSMIHVLLTLLSPLVSILALRRDLALENLALP